MTSSDLCALRHSNHDTADNQIEWFVLDDNMEETFHVDCAAALRASGEFDSIERIDPDDEDDV
jgi:hypothetical protein